MVSCHTKTESQKSESFENDSVNREEIISNEKQSNIASVQESLTLLPFNSGEWLDWRNSVDTGGIEDDGRYVFYYLEDNPHIEDICGSILKKDTTIYGYFLLDTKKEFKTYLLRLTTNEVGVHFEIVNMHNEKILSHLYLGAFTPSIFIAFNISLDLKIEQYKYDLDNSSEEKIILGRYQIENDGSIIELKE